MVTNLREGLKVGFLVGGLDGNRVGLNGTCMSVC